MPRPEAVVGRVKTQKENFNPDRWLRDMDACFLEREGLLKTVSDASRMTVLMEWLAYDMCPRFMPTGLSLAANQAYQTVFRQGVQTFGGFLTSLFCSPTQYVTNERIVRDGRTGTQVFGDATKICELVFARFREASSEAEVEGFIVAARMTRENIGGSKFRLRTLLHNGLARNSGLMAAWLQDQSPTVVNQLMVLACAQAVGNYIYNTLQNLFQPGNVLMTNGWQHAVVNYSLAVSWYGTPPPGSRLVANINTSVAQAYDRTAGHSESDRQQVVLGALQ